MKYLPAAAVAMALVAGTLAAQTSAVTPQEAVAKLEKALKAVRTLRADFEQLHYSMSVSEPLREKGELLFEKPDRMRWEYKSPQDKVFLYKGGILETYLREEKQLTRSPVAEEALKEGGRDQRQHVAQRLVPAQGRAAVHHAPDAVRGGEARADQRHVLAHQPHDGVREIRRLRLARVHARLAEVRGRGVAEQRDLARAVRCPRPAGPPGAGRPGGRAG